jgi:hypothetical protein
MASAKDTEIDRNFEYFQSVVSNLLAQHRGQFALLKSQAIAGYFSSAAAATIEGHKRFPDDVFSVQEVIGVPLDLGFYSHAAGERLAR